MTRKRQLEKNEEIRALILEAARRIISEEGFEQLSIRKIVREIDYSPAIVYHYFKDKNEIVETLVGEGYMKILAALRHAASESEEPIPFIQKTLTDYILAALASPQEYKAFMLRDADSVLSTTGLLTKGIAQKSGTIRVLADKLQEGIDRGDFAACDTELTAQIIWTATFGLIMKLIIEKNITGEQTDRLIAQHLNMLLHGLMARKDH